MQLFSLHGYIRAVSSKNESHIEELDKGQEKASGHHWADIKKSTQCLSENRRKCSDSIMLCNMVQCSKRRRNLGAQES